MSIDFGYRCKTCNLDSQCVSKIGDELVAAYKVRDAIAKVVSIPDVKVFACRDRDASPEIFDFLAVHKDHDLWILEDGCRECCVCGNRWCCGDRQVHQCKIKMDSKYGKCGMRYHSHDCDCGGAGGDR